MNNLALKGRQLLRLSSLHLWIAVCLLSALAGCGGLGGEPRIVATLPPASPAPQDVGVPTAPPDLALGAEIYAARCTRCHGLDGRGEGELVLAGQIAQPPDMTNPATSQAQTPGQWFATITNGRLELGMPPWSQALNEAQRWAVALYTYSLAYSQEELAQGQQIWQGQCARCHGESGLGDGPDAAELGVPVGDLADLSWAVSSSDEDLQRVIAAGGQNMPAFGDELDEQARRAVAAYARTLSLRSVEVIGQALEPVATAEVAPLAESVPGQVIGRVLNGTQGASLPPDLTLRLVLHDAGSVDQRETAINADGTFLFSDVPIRAGTSYFTSVTYNEQLFLSEILQGDPTAPTLNLPLTIYETTDDAEVISISRMLIRVNPTERSGEIGLEVAQFFVFNNRSDRMFLTGREVAENQFESLILPLPAGAEILGVDDPQRYTFSEDGTAVIDTEAVLPGESHRAQVVYFLPYREGMTVEQTLNQPFEGSLRFMLWPDVLDVAGEGAAFIGQQQSQGLTYRVFDGQVTRAKGDVLSYTLSGAVSSGTVQSTAAATTPLTTVLAGGLIAVGALLVTAGAVIFMRDRRNTRAERKQQIDALLLQIAELDQAYEAGEIQEKAYQRQRGHLKTRLTDLMEKPGRTQEE